jgi:hypothetical protein
MGSPRAQRQPPEPELPTPMLTAPPIFTQVSVPSTLTKPGPYAAQALPLAARLTGSCLSGFADLSGIWPLGGSTSADEAGSNAMRIARRVFRIPPFSAGDLASLPDGLDANRSSAAPGHLAIPPALALICSRGLHDPDGLKNP